MKAKLIRVKPETDNIISFAFEPEEPIERVAGHFLRYVLPHPHMDNRRDDRYFTISSAPFEHFIQITTRFAPQSSSFKKALRQLSLGATIQVDEPQGEFVVTDFKRNYIFVAGGMGITPFRSILAEANHNGQKIKAHVLYGSRDKDILFKDELDDFARHNPDLSIEYITDAKGITADRLTQVVEQVNDPYVYLSGPEPMVESLAVVVKKLGLDIGHIQTDFFTGYDSNS
ncbi:MAG TPA: FAD-dependent oxidoreductase [Candidatus Saccharimonadales bacterium]|nr:FAD-dependent oxidoreductase [Candidatus Saccharimonadales bacterium]